MCYENRTLRILLGFHANCFGCCNPAVDYEDVIMRLSNKMNMIFNENTDMMFIRINIKYNIMITFTLRFTFSLTKNGSLDFSHIKHRIMKYVENHAYVIEVMKRTKNGKDSENVISSKTL